MKSIYDDDIRYSDDASELDDKTTKLVQPLFREYLKLGYNPREICQVIERAVQSEMYLQMLEFRGKNEKA